MFPTRLLLKMSASASVPTPFTTQSLSAATTPLLSLVEKAGSRDFQLRLCRDSKDSNKDTVMIAARSGPHVKVTLKDLSGRYMDSTLLTERTRLSAYLRTLFHSMFADDELSHHIAQVFAPGFPTMLVTLKKLREDAEARDVIYDIADITERCWFAPQEKK